MSYLQNILEAIKGDIKANIILELKKEQYNDTIKILPEQMISESEFLTEAVINTIKLNTFTPFKTYLSWMCKQYIEVGVKLSELMEFFDIYEVALKDAMAAYLINDLVSLNRYRREIDALLDKARVYLSEYFFVLYEETVLKQFEQLKVINDITAHLTSSLDLNEVLNFIVTNAINLFKADCGSILLFDHNNTFLVPVAHGWKFPCLPLNIVQTVTLEKGITVINKTDLGDPLKKTFRKENLSTIIAIKLLIHERVIGVLLVGFKFIEKVTSNEERVLLTFANQAAIAVYNAQRYGEKDNRLRERVREVSALLEQNHALVHAIREGILAINAAGIITLINNEAQRMLNIEEDVVGKHILSIVPNSRLPIVVETQKAEYDQEQKIGEDVVIINLVPVIAHGEVIGAISTFRDRQDVKQLAEELVGIKSLLDSMRAQSHEFLNKLHAISGLIELKQYDKVVELITNTYKNRQECISFIAQKIKDHATAGLLLGKISRSHEQAIKLCLSPRSKLTALPRNFNSISMVTVLGNLISNAIDAVTKLSVERRIIKVHIFQGKKFLTIMVKDFGNGIPKSIINKIYQRGFSTKPGSRGVGLALVKQEVEVSGGKIMVHSIQNQGSEFIVKIPVR